MVTILKRLNAEKLNCLRIINTKDGETVTGGAKDYQNVRAQLVEMFGEPNGRGPTAQKHSVSEQFVLGMKAFIPGLFHDVINHDEWYFDTKPYPIKIERCIMAILFHDYGKVYEYKENGETTEQKYLLGHIFISANRLYSELKKHKINDDEINYIVHAVLAHHGELEYGSPVKPCSQEAIIVNMLDNLSAKTDTIEFTGNMESSFALGTHVVKKP